MGADHKTPTMRPTTGRIGQCPHCKRKDVVITPAGLFELHPVTRRWKKEMCRGSGKPARPARQ